MIKPSWVIASNARAFSHDCEWTSMFQRERSSNSQSSSQDEVIFYCFLSFWCWVWSLNNLGKLNSLLSIQSTCRNSQALAQLARAQANSCELPPSKEQIACSRDFRLEKPARGNPRSLRWTNEMTPNKLTRSWAFPRHLPSP